MAIDGLTSVLRRGEPAPSFTLPAIDRDGMVSLSDAVRAPSSSGCFVACTARFAEERLRRWGSFARSSWTLASTHWRS